MTSASATPSAANDKSSALSLRDGGALGAAYSEKKRKEYTPRIAMNSGVLNAGGCELYYFPDTKICC